MAGGDKKQDKEHNQIGEKKKMGARGQEQGSTPHSGWRYKVGKERKVTRLLMQ